MSTILKALRRLEQERSKDAERPLKEAVVYARPRSLGPWGHRSLIGVALILGFSVTWAFLPKPSSDGREEASTAAVAAPAAIPLRVPPPVAAPGATPGTGVADPAPIASQAPELPPRELRPPVEAPAPAASIEPGPSARVAAVAPIEGRAPRLVEDEPAARRAGAEIPVHVVRTTWHPRAERRAAWVTIDGADPREVHEGEWVGALEIRTIEPDGILFADGPILVHRRIGER